MIRLLLLILALGSGAPSSAAPGNELPELRQKLERLRADLAGTEGQKTEAADALRESEHAISAANLDLRELGQAQEAARAELGRLGGETRAVRAALDKRQSELARLLYGRYTAGDIGTLRLLLSGTNPGRTARELVYYAYVSRAQADFIDKLRADVARLASLEERARDKAAELQGLESDARAEMQRLLDQQAERQKVLDRFANQIREQRGEVKSLERNEARLARLAEALAQTLRSAPPPSPPPPQRATALPDAAAAGPFSLLKGKLHLPVRGELANRFGSPRADGETASKGVFIAAPGGTVVHAVAPGRVVFNDWMRGFGNLVILDHGEGYLTIYGHNEAVLKRVGDAVHTGEPIATVGNSGGAETSGVYFEIRYQGKPFDPLSWVSLK